MLSFLRLFEYGFDSDMAINPYSGTSTAGLLCSRAERFDVQYLIENYESVSFKIEKNMNIDIFNRI